MENYGKIYFELRSSIFDISSGLMLLTEAWNLGMIKSPQWVTPAWML